VGGAALALSYLRRLPLFFEVRDLWPESAVALGELSNPKAIALAEWLEKLCYRRARRIVVVTRGIYNQLLQRGYSPDKLTLIPNGSNAELFQFLPDARISLRDQLGLQNKFVIIYAGIHGIAQGLETVIEAAVQLKSQSNIHFLFVGEGPVKQQIVNLANEYKLSNVTFHPEVPRQQMPAFLSAADIALVPLRRLDLFTGALPSKMFDAWACQCPTIITIDGEAKDVLIQAQAGLFAEPEKPDEVVKAILHLKENPTNLQQMGLNGRQMVLNHFSRQAQAGELANILVNNLVGR
jgi:glycosyltransferase involved in cell wall biosynthesis